MHLKYFWNAHTEIKKKIVILWLDLSAQFLLQVNRFQQMYGTKKYKHYQDQDTCTFTVYILSQKPPPSQRPLWVKQ